jgi:hypothetical protein
LGKNIFQQFRLGVFGGGRGFPAAFGGVYI